MSKFYKAEDVIRKRAEDLADTSYWEWGNPKNIDEWIEVAEMEFKDIPTIEVSEEVLKATKNFNCYTIADENAEMGMRTQIEPIIEVSEDCISREYLKSFEYINKGDFNSVETIREWIDNAPSVVPSEDCISRAEVIAEFERRKDKLYEDDYFDELMWIIENIESVVPKQSELTEAYTRGYKDGAEQSRAEGEWVEVVKRTEQYDREGRKSWAVIYQCPNCGFVLNAIENHITQYNYCPECGSKMKGADDD